MRLHILFLIYLSFINKDIYPKLFDDTLSKIEMHRRLLDSDIDINSL
jgi:hypothetical protein